MVIYGPHVGKYTSPMDAMGKAPVNFPMSPGRQFPNHQVDQLRTYAVWNAVGVVTGAANSFGRWSDKKTSEGRMPKMKKHLQTINFWVPCQFSGGVYGGYLYSS